MSSRGRIAYIFTDGASRGNPGPASFGVWINELGRRSHGFGEFLGDSLTNNVAEYRGVVRGLEEATALLEASDDIDCVCVCSDSELLVKQLTGVYAVNAPSLVPLHAQARRLLDAMKPSIDLVHVRRAANALADRMANRALDARAPISVDVLETTTTTTKKKRTRS